MAQKQNFKVTLKRNAEDFFQGSQYAMRENSKATSLYIVLGTIVGAVVAAAIFEAGRDLNFLPQGDKFVTALIAFLLGYILILFLMQYFLKYGRFEYLNKKGNFLTPKIFSMNEKGVQETSEHYDSATTWKGILKIEKSPTHILYYVDNVQAYYIPLNSFKDEAEAQDFYATSLELWKAGKKTKRKTTKKTTRAKK